MTCPSRERSGGPGCASSPRRIASRNFSPPEEEPRCVRPPPHPWPEQKHLWLRPEVLLARIHELRIQAQNHSRMQREHARVAAALLAEAVRLEEQALQLALPLSGSGRQC